MTRETNWNRKKTEVETGTPIPGGQEVSMSICFFKFLAKADKGAGII